MATEDRTRKEATLNVEEGQVKSDQNNEHGTTSAHSIGHDSWQQVALMLVTSYSCGYILSFSNLMLVPLGWTWGIICLVVIGAFIAYANWLLAGFHFINGHRFIRYRDLMGAIFGKRMYFVTWAFQFLTLLLGNMGFILLGGKALKEINAALSDSPLRLQYFIIITGIAFFVFAFFVPTLSAMKIWLGGSFIVTSTYVATIVVVLAKDGQSNANKDYKIKGSTMDQVFNAFGAISAIVVCNTFGLLPEVQATLRMPAIKNMRKALYMQYTVGLVSYYGVSIMGYWAYGTSVSDYLPRQFRGSKWVKVLINSTVFLQSIVSQHMFVAPIHETLDTKFLKLDERMHSKENIKRLFYLRAVFFAGNTFVTAAFPFMGDFVSLFGSFTLIPLTFLFPSMIFLKVKGKVARLEERVWHWFNIVIFSFLTVATTAAATRIIANNVQMYNFFADA